MAHLSDQIDPPRPEGRLRLTRRGRVTIVAAAMLGLFAFFSLGRVSLQAATGPGRAPQLRHLVVTSGQTLWEIANQVAPDSDPRATVDELMALNHLGRPQLVPGEVLVLPPSQ
ncbi:MAG TPA: LysM peptidoglycan-binding domain-containing protein [Mycobacteriales bacterium]|nr:LysM peptidoglycan-binding domain-containing protein [Mycobacteriales bacterium]